MNKNKIIWIIVGIVVVVALIAVVMYFVNKNGSALPNAANSPVGTKTDYGTVTPSGVVAVPGTSAIASSGVVIAPTGQATQNNVQPSAPTAPQQSNPIANQSDIPAKAIKLDVSTAGFAPNAFTVSAGAAITVSITGSDNLVHVFAFQDPSLSAVAVGVGPGETRAITFNAPTKAGDYKFYSNVPGQSGETGVMTVK